MLKSHFVDCSKKPVSLKQPILEQQKAWNIIHPRPQWSTIFNLHIQSWELTYVVSLEIFMMILQTLHFFSW